MKEIIVGSVQAGAMLIAMGFIGWLANVDWIKQRVGLVILLVLAAILSGWQALQYGNQAYKVYTGKRDAQKNKDNDIYHPHEIPY
jgi:hypothetical protein